MNLRFFANSPLHFADNLKIHPIYQPDEERRARLFSVLLVCVFVLCAPVAVYAISVLYFGNAIPKIDLGFQEDNLTGVAIAAGATSIFALIAFLLNRARKLPLPRVVASLFIIAITAFVVLSDTPAEVIAGRTSYMLLVPIFLTSVLVHSAAGVLVAILEIVTFLALAPEQAAMVTGPATFSNFTLVMMYFFALLTWASAHSAESAIAAALRESTKNTTILESAADGLVVFDLDGRAVQINSAAKRLLNEGSPADLLRAITATEGQDGVWRVEWRSRILSVTKAPIVENGQAVGTVLGIRDYSREVAVERMKDAILGVVSHELRTPASAIKGYIDLIRSGVIGGDTLKEAIENIGYNVQRLLFLINDLLDRASIQAGKLKILNSRFSVASLVERVKDVVANQLEDKEGKVGLSFVVDGDIPEMMVGDVNRLWQCMVNLVNNGLKFTDKGSVDVHLFVPDPEHWAIEVKDTGIGIPENVFEFIFEPLRRAPDYATRDHQGAGLGLSITKELVTLMEGNINVESKVGEGSIFRITLPFLQMH